MSDYERILPALAHYEGLARATCDGSFSEAANKSFSLMQQAYYSPVHNPDYSADLTKFCYLFKYSVAHGYYIFNSLKRLRPKIKPSIFSRSPTRIACVGGGPGTELIGLCRYLREVESYNIGNSVEITIFDLELSWKEACARVLECVRGDMAVSFKFVKFDATKPETFIAIDFSKFHLVMANFFTSEIRKARIKQASAKFWQHMFKSMGAGKIFVAVDFADANGQGWSYINSVIPADATRVLEDKELGMTCPDSKNSILALEAEFDHRPKKNAQNFVMAVIT